MLQIVGKLSKRRGQERKRARERCASETATQREVMLAKHHQQHTDMYAFFSEMREACPSYNCEVSRVLEIAQRTNNFYSTTILDVTSRLTPHKVLFRYTGIPFGVASAPAILQHVMESILRDLSHVCVYLDDILVMRESKAAHLRNLATVLDRLEFAGIHLKRESVPLCFRRSWCQKIVLSSQVLSLTTLSGGTKSST